MGLTGDLQTLRYLRICRLSLALALLAILESSNIAVSFLIISNSVYMTMNSYP
jgi:hypothetical protein